MDHRELSVGARPSASSFAGLFQNAAKRNRDRQARAYAALRISDRRLLRRTSGLEKEKPCFFPQPRRNRHICPSHRVRPAFYQVAAFRYEGPRCGRRRDRCGAANHATCGARKSSPTQRGTIEEGPSTNLFLDGSHHILNIVLKFVCVSIFKSSATERPFVKVCKF